MTLKHVKSKKKWADALSDMQQNGAQTLEDQMRGHGQISLIGSATDVTLTTVVVISFVEHCSQPVKVKYSMPHWY